MKGIIVLIYALMLASTSCSKKNGPSSNPYIESPVTDNGPILGDDSNISNPGNEGDSNTGNDQDGDNGQNDGNQGNDNDDNQGNDGNTDGNENPQTDVYFPENGQKELDNCYGGFKVVNGEKLKCGTHVKTRVFTVTDCNTCEENKITTKVIEKKHKKVKKQKKQKVKKVKVKKEKKQKVKKVKKEKEGPGFWERIFGKKEKKVKKVKVKKQKEPKVKKEKLQKKKTVKVKKEKVQKVKKVKVKKEKLQKKKTVKVKKEKVQKVKKVKVKKEKLQKKKTIKVKKQKEPKVKKEKKQKVKKVKKIKKIKVKKKKEKKQKEPVVIEEPRDPETPIVVTPKPIVINPPVIEVPVVDIKPIVIDEPKEETRDKKANPAELVEGITSQFGVEADNLDVESVRNNSLALNLLSTRFANASACTLKTPLAAKDFVKLNAKGYPVDLNRTLSLNDVTFFNVEDANDKFVGDIELSTLFADILKVSVRSSDLSFDTDPNVLMAEMNGAGLVPSFDYQSYKVTPGTSTDTFLHKAATVIKDGSGNKIGSRKVTIYFTKDQVKALELTTQNESSKKTYCLAN